nr:MULTISPECIES: hypothetical protein [unclassified Arthrospira]
MSGFPQISRYHLCTIMGFCQLLDKWRSPDMIKWKIWTKGV